MKRILFVADYYLVDGIGGAELTTQALIDYLPDLCAKNEVTSCYSWRLTKSVIDELKDDTHFIVCNFDKLNDKIKLYMCKNVSYSIVEYDYKICKYRSFELHQLIEGKPCDCETKVKGKINSAFFGYAEKVWFMSEKQKNMICEKISVLDKDKCEVLSSVFNEGDLRFIDSLKNNKKNDTYLILNSPSPVKATEQCVKYAVDNNLKYELVSQIPYHELLIKLSTSKGIVFLPRSSDTCPRIIIESKLLNCDVILNENVQHKDEKWFQNSESCMAYLKTRNDKFWKYYEKL